VDAQSAPIADIARNRPESNKACSNPRQSGMAWDEQGGVGLSPTSHGIAGIGQNPLKPTPIWDGLG